MRRIKNYETMLKEELTISLLKSKDSIAELFNNNLDGNKRSDIKRTKKYRNKIKKKTLWNRK